MSTALFVTCGRGLSTIATEEIKEKIPNVCDIQPRGEGKLSFTINHIPCAPQPESSTGGANEDEHTQKEVVLVDCDTVGEKDVKVTKKQEDTKYVNAIVPVFKLKLVERIFLLLHCEEFGNDELASVIKTPNTEENCCEKLSGHEEISGFEQTKNLYKMLSLDEISSCGSKIMTPKSIIKDCLSLAQRSLSLRRYIPHLTLRSTICYLMAKLSQIPPGGVLLDPMCGGGTILLEAATNFEVGHVIASDLSAEQLEVARCNLRNLSIPASLLHAHAAALPLHSTSVDAVICDFPFGQKYKVEMDSLELLRAVLAECQRVLVFGGRAVFLTSTQEHQRLLRLTSHSVSSLLRNQVPVILTLEREDYVALGETSAYVVVLLKEMSKT